MDHLIRKAGFNGASVSVRSMLKVTRYCSTTCSLSYEEYAVLKEGSGSGGRRLHLKKQHPLVAVALLL